MTDNEKSIVFGLARPARESGGDRYEAEVGQPDPWVLYIPQFLSRKDGSPAPAFRITFEVEK